MGGVNTSAGARLHRSSRIWTNGFGGDSVATCGPSGVRASDVELAFGNWESIPSWPPMVLCSAASGDLAPRSPCRSRSTMPTSMASIFPVYAFGELNLPNRRIRFRMYGGVGGAESRDSPLSRLTANRAEAIWRITHNRTPSGPYSLSDRVLSFTHMCSADIVSRMYRYGSIARQSRLRVLIAANTSTPSTGSMVPQHL